MQGRYGASAAAIMCLSQIKLIAAKGLPPIITADMLTGDAVQCLGSNGRSGVAHEYISQSGENVMILAFGEQYYYLFPSSQQESE